MNEFTVIFDAEVSELGLIPGAVLGVVKRFCAMRGRSCFASQGTIAAKLRVSTKSVGRALKLLRDKRYLVDTTPDLVGRPHIYVTADMVAKLPTSDSQSDNSRTDSPTPNDENMPQNAITSDSQSEGTDSESDDLGLTVRGGRTHSPTRITNRNTIEEDYEETISAIAQKDAQSQSGSDEPEPAIQELGQEPVFRFPIQEEDLMLARRALKRIYGGWLPNEVRKGIRDALGTHGAPVVFAALKKATENDAHSWADVVGLLAEVQPLQEAT